MDKPRQTLCLNMIVRNERPVLARCLASVRELISYWVIIDTGSTDGTQELVRESLRGIAGELIERPWVDFAHNRTEALEHARGKADWLLLLDADETLVFEDGFRWPELEDDVYLVEVRSGDVSFERPLLVKNTSGLGYQGVVHEALEFQGEKRIGLLSGVTNLARHDGARSRDPNRFKRDALLLEAALLNEPDDARLVFYLAQSRGGLVRALSGRIDAAPRR
jgi:glycosyltransferase involved in cell wall biosynthesis